MVNHSLGLGYPSPVAACFFCHCGGFYPSFALVPLRPLVGSGRCATPSRVGRKIELHRTTRAVCVIYASPGTPNRRCPQFLLWVRPGLREFLSSTQDSRHCGPGLFAIRPPVNRIPFTQTIHAHPVLCYHPRLPETPPSTTHVDRWGQGLEH